MNYLLRSTPKPVRFQPEEPGSRHDYTQAIVRAAVAHGLGRIDKDLSPAAHAERMWPNDQDVQFVLRAAAPPLDTTSAAALVQIVLAILPILVPFSAAATLFGRGLKVTLGRGAVSVPNVGTVGVAFVADGAPKPVLQGITSASRLDPHKIAGIAVVSSELYQQGSIEPVIRQMLGESAGPALDAVVFSNQAASAAHPAGLLAGIAPLTAAAATPGSDDAFVADIKALGDAIGSVAGAGGITFVGSPGQIESTHYRVPGIEPAYMPFIASAAVPPGTIIAIANNAIVSALGVPEYEANTEATVTMDTAPSAFPAGTVQSLWQTASVGVKMVYECTWALRSNKGVAFVQGVNW